VLLFVRSWPFRWSGFDPRYGSNFVSIRLRLISFDPIAGTGIGVGQFRKNRERAP
jgi:hypothetical protein